MKLLPYQETGVEFLMSAKRKLLLDDMGLGKTLQAVIAAKRKKAKSIIVVCPPAVMYSWKECFESETDYNVDIAQGRMYRIEIDVEVMILPYSICSSPYILHQIGQRQWSILIMDEVHFLKNATSKRTKAILGTKGIAKKFSVMWGLSGTFMLNRPIELYTVMRVMRPKEIAKKYVSYPYFTKTFCDAKMKFNRLDVSGSRNLDKLSSLLFDTGFALRRTRKEVLKELKPADIRLIPVAQSISSDDRIDSSNIRRVKIDLEETSMAELRKETAVEKIEGCIEYIRYALEANDKILVFTWTKEVTQRLKEELNDVGALTYYGDDSPAQKKQNKTRFETLPEHRVLICNIVSAGTGVDGLQRVCNYCIFVEPDWTPAGMNQAIARLQRMGQLNPVTVDVLITKGSIEEYIMHSVLRKTKNIQILMRK